MQQVRKTMNVQNEDQIDENAITRFFHNVKFKMMFSKTYIKDWVKKYTWDKTPTTPENLTVARCTLLELVPVYTQLGSMDRKKFDAAQRGAYGILGAFFKGFFKNLFERIKGNPGKIDAIIKFNQSMKGQVKLLSDTVEAFINALDKEKKEFDKKAGLSGMKMAAEAGEENQNADNADNANADNADQGEQNEGLEAAVDGFVDALDRMLDEIKASDAKDAPQVRQFLDLCEGEMPGENGRESFNKMCLGLKKPELENDLTAATEVIQAKLNEEDPKKAGAFIEAFVKQNPQDVESFIQTFITVNKSAGKGDNKAGEEAYADLADVVSHYSTANDEKRQEIMWEKSPLFSLANVYVAENCLYKVMVFLDAIVNNFNAGKVYDKDGNMRKLQAKQMSDFLKSPAGKSLTRMSDIMGNMNKVFQSSSAFGSLQESAAAELGVELNLITERQEQMKNKKLKRTNEALNRLKQCMEIAEPAPVEPEVPKDAQECNKAPALTLEFDFSDQDPVQDKLDHLKDLVYDGEPPEMEPPVEEAAPKPIEDTKDEIINVVTEAPPAPNPNDPNAQDPNAAPAPDVPMSTADLGTPPVDPNDPTAGGTADDTAAAPPADPAAGGGDAGPMPPAGADAAAEEPGEDQQNAAGETPNGADTAAGTNKFDIGVDRPYNDATDTLKLTDQESEQLFTKINLLTKVPDLVNFGKYLYNLTPENVDLEDIHYINALYKLCVKLELLTDEFEGNNLLDKFDSYKYSVISKNPEQTLQDAGQQVSEASKKVKIEATGETVEVVTAPGVVIAKDVDDYMKQKDDANAEAAGEIKFKDTLDRVRGLGSLVTFTGVLFGYPTIKTLFVKGPKGEEVVKDEAIKQLNHQGYRDVEILAIETIDPIDYLYREYAGMRTLEDEFTREFMKQRLEKKVAKAVGNVNESVEVGNGIPEDFNADIGRIVDNLNKEIMEDPTVDFSNTVGLPKMMVAKEDFEKCFVASPVMEDADGCDGYNFCILRTNTSGLGEVLFSEHSQKICKMLEGIASTYGYTLEATAEGDNILKGADKINLTFRK